MIYYAVVYWNETPDAPEKGLTLMAALDDRGEAEKVCEKCNKEQGEGGGTYSVMAFNLRDDAIPME